MIVASPSIRLGGAVDDTPLPCLKTVPLWHQNGSNVPGNCIRSQFSRSSTRVIVDVRHSPERRIENLVGQNSDLRIPLVLGASRNSTQSPLITVESTPLVFAMGPLLEVLDCTRDEHPPQASKVLIW